MCCFEKIVNKAAEEGAKIEFIRATEVSSKRFSPFGPKIAEEPALNISHPNQRKKVPKASCGGLWQ